MLLAWSLLDLLPGCITPAIRTGCNMWRLGLRALHVFLLPAAQGGTGGAGFCANIFVQPHACSKDGSCCGLCLHHQDAIMHAVEQMWLIIGPASCRQHCKSLAYSGPLGDFQQLLLLERFMSVSSKSRAPVRLTVAVCRLRPCSGS
jgi:hypothetical protein